MTPYIPMRNNQEIKSLANINSVRFSSFEEWCRWEKADVDARRKVGYAYEAIAEGLLQ